MSRFFSPRHAALEPYVPGEQPRDQVYIKLNTNESPFPPSPKAAAMAAEAAKTLQLYSDPECRALKEQFTKVFGIPGDRVLFTFDQDGSLVWVLVQHTAASATPTPTPASTPAATPTPDGSAQPSGTPGAGESPRPSPSTGTGGGARIGGGSGGGGAAASASPPARPAPPKRSSPPTPWQNRRSAP